MAASNTMIDLSKNGYSMKESTTLTRIPEARRVPVEIEVCVTRPLDQGYQWFNKKNEREFYELYEGYVIVCEQRLSHQIPIYKYKLITIATRDMAEHVAYRASHELGYKGFWHEYLWDPFPAKKFSINNWVFFPLGEYASFIPPKALKALRFLDSLEIQPNLRWVLEEQKKTDPILCVNYWRFVVGVAAWK